MRHPVLPKGRELGLPLASGVLLALAFPPFHLLFPSFLALVPYLVFVDSCPDDRGGTASVRRATFWMGIVFYGLLLYWLFTALVWYTWLALLGYLITIVVLSIFLAAAGWGIHFFRTRYRMPFWLAVPLFWTATEWLRGHLGDVSFPWLGLSHSLTGFPALVGFADLTGARGVTVWLTAINGLLAEGWVRRERLRRGRWALALSLVVLLPLGYSLARWWTLEMRPAARVAVVQPNIPEHIKLDPDAARDSSRVALGSLSRAALESEDGLDLMIWPETALPGFFEAHRGWTLWAARLAQRNDIALLFGTLDLERYADGDFDYYNAALLLDDGGNRAGLYRKHYLVPVVERVPFIPLSAIRAARRRGAEGWRLPLIGDLNAFLRYFGGFGRGSEEPLMPVQGSDFGVLICYESIFADLSRTYRRAGSDFLVNITNDAWFGRERPWWSRTSALYQHPAHLVMRAIENRVGVARAANTGISLFVNPRGQVYAATELFVPTVSTATVLTTEARTVYTRVGDWPGWLSVLAVVILVAGAWWRRRGSRKRADTA